MSNSDKYYRAFTDYRKVTKEEKKLERQRKSIASSDADKDRIEVVRTNCIIDDDWIVAIEEGLVHVEKAIKEERQFIRSNGEVVPIEKVKNVSKESVEHLAKHSNLLTRVTEGEDLIPDGLYTVERLSDFAVYENRFLYMLLCYLRDFISYRYDKILELVYTYNGSLELNKRIHSSSRNTVYNLTMKDERKNDPYLKANNPAKDKIDRIDLILKTVLAFLSTPLMEFVSKAPMIKPPITETNVLKMNKNFKGAKELYYFISSYPKEGFTAEKITDVINPFSEEIADEFAESIELGAFLTYEYGLGIEKQLKTKYDKDEQKRREEEKAKRAEQLENLRKRVKQSGQGVEEYMLMLEQRNRTLEKDSERLKAVTQELDSANDRIFELNEKKVLLEEQLDGKVKEIEELKVSHSEEIRKLNEDHENEVNTLNSEHEKHIEDLNAAHIEQVETIHTAHREQIENINSSHKEEIEKLNFEHGEQVTKLNEKFEDEKNRLNGKIYACKTENEQMKSEYDDLNAQLAQANEDKILLAGRLNALRHEQGLFTAEDDFTTEESFDEIERQYKAFRTFFKTEWKSAKKKIRKEYLNKEQILINSQKKKKEETEEQAKEQKPAEEEIPVREVPAVKEEPAKVAETDADGFNEPAKMGVYEKMIMSEKIPENIMDINKQEISETDNKDTDN